MELLGSALVFLMIVMLGIVLMRRHDSRNQQRQLLQRIAQPAVKEVPQDTGITREARRSEGLFGDLLDRMRLLHRLQELLGQAGISALAGEMLIVIILLAGVGAVAGWAWYGSTLLSVTAPALGLGVLPVLYVLWRRQRRLSAFDQQLPEVLDLLKASLEAGHTLQRALQVGVDEFSEPAASELKLVLDQNSLGVPLERSLEFMLQRLPNENLRFLVTAVKIQAQAGTSLARIIGELARTVRDRHRMEMKLRVLTAQPRITGLAAGFMPIFVGIGMHFINPEQVRMLFFDPAGVTITKAAIALEVIAFLVIYRMVRLDY
jgi:tight adherence protein B